MFFDGVESGAEVGHVACLYSCLFELFLEGFYLPACVLECLPTFGFALFECGDTSFQCLVLVSPGDAPGGHDKQQGHGRWLRLHHRDRSLELACVGLEYRRTVVGFHTTSRSMELASAMLKDCHVLGEPSVSGAEVHAAVESP